MNQPWVYFFGTDDFKHIKVGYTTTDLNVRRAGIERGQLGNVSLYLLAAVHGTSTNEREIHRYFKHLAADANSTELFRADDEIVEYVNWLREQWWTALAYDDQDLSDQPAWTQWRPQPDRRIPLQEEDPTTLVQRYDAFGPLAGTPWARLSTPEPVGEDYYTPAELVQAARTAMGGIDLDPASHWRANREHKIPTFYHLGRSAFENPWFGRIWLNPPYGNNAPWFQQIIQYWGIGDIQQLVMISPVWAFTAQQAKPITDLASAMVLLSPTPEFWGNPEGRKGTNHPHAVMYLGSRVREFRKAFEPFGVTVQFQEKLDATPGREQL